MNAKQRSILQKRIALFDCTWEDIQEAYPELSLQDAVFKATMEVFPNDWVHHVGARLAAKKTEEEWRGALYEIITPCIPLAGPQLITKEPIESCHGYYTSPLFLDPWIDVLTKTQRRKYERFIVDTNN